MAFVHGKNTAFKLDNAAGSLTDISAYTEDVQAPMELDASEVTTFGSGGNKQYIAGLAGSKITLTGKWDPTLDTHLGELYAAFIAGTVATASFEYGPEGSGNAKPKRSGEVILTSFEVSSKVGDPNDWKAELQVTGAVTRGTFS